MTSNGGFQSFYPSNQDRGNQQYNSSNGYNRYSFNRSNTYIPQNPYQNNGFLPPQQNSFQQNIQHSNTFYQQHPINQPLPQQNQYFPPQVQQNHFPSQNNFLNRSNTYMPPSPYQNPPQMFPFHNQQQNMIPPQIQYMPPSQQPLYMGPLPKMQRANTYFESAPRRETIYDNLDIRPHHFAPEPPMTQKQMVSSNFNPEEDCKILRNAVHGWGTDEKAIINVIINRNAAQRAEIRRTYKACFGKDLIKRLKEDTSGNFKDVVAAMFMTPAEFDAMCLYKAMKGLGTHEGVLIEIIGTRTSQQLMEIKDAFQREYNQSLEKWVKGDTSGNFRNLLIALLQCNRSMNPNPDPNMCQQDAQMLYNAGEGRWGTDESTFIRIFANRSPAEMAMINDCYTRLRGKGLLKAIDKEFSGDIKKLLETVVGGLVDPAGYFAQRIREAVKGLGTNDSKLVRVIVSRSEIDLGLIKRAYQTMYGRDMLNDVRSDTSGYYKEILTGLISRCP